MTTAMFGSCFLRIPGVRFQIHVLSKHAVDSYLDEETQLEMEKLYDKYKRRFELGGAAWYMSVTADLAKKASENFKIFQEESKKDTLRWFVNKF